MTNADGSPSLNEIPVSCQGCENLEDRGNGGVEAAAGSICMLQWASVQLIPPSERSWASAPTAARVQAAMESTAPLTPDAGFRQRVEGANDSCPLTLEVTKVLAGPRNSHQRVFLIPPKPLLSVTKS